MSGRKSHGYKSVVYLPSISGEKTNPFPGNTHLVDIPLSGGIFPLQIEPSSAQTIGFMENYVPNIFWLAPILVVKPFFFLKILFLH